MLEAVCARESRESCQVEGREMRRARDSKPTPSLQHTHTPWEPHRCTRYMQRVANVDNPRVVFLRECALADARQAQARSKAEGGDEDDFDREVAVALAHCWAPSTISIRATDF